MSGPRRSSSEIERETVASRSDLNETISELKDRFSPEAAMEYGTNYMRGPGGQRLLEAARENPLAAVMALAGIGWLVYTANRPRSERSGALAPAGRQSFRSTSADWNRRDDMHAGMMGDGTEEQNLNQPGDPSARITREEVQEAFGRDRNSDDLSR